MFISKLAVAIVFLVIVALTYYAVATIIENRKAYREAEQKRIEEFRRKHGIDGKD